MNNPYEILGISPGATEKEMGRAYKRLVRKWHLDLNPGNKEAEEKFKTISSAYEVLKDGKKVDSVESGFHDMDSDLFNQTKSGFHDMDNDLFDLLNQVYLSGIISDFELVLGLITHLQNNRPKGRERI